MRASQHLPGAAVDVRAQPSHNDADLEAGMQSSRVSGRDEWQFSLHVNCDCMRCALLEPTRKARDETGAAPQRRSRLQERDSEVLDAGGFGHC